MIKAGNINCAKFSKGSSQRRFRPRGGDQLKIRCPASNTSSASQKLGTPRKMILKRRDTRSVPEFRLSADIMPRGRPIMVPSIIDIIASCPVIMARFPISVMIGRLVCRESPKLPLGISDIQTRYWTARGLFRPSLRGDLPRRVNCPLPQPPHSFPEDGEVKGDSDPAALVSALPT